MSLSLLGLLFFQGQWINALLEENKKRFENDVQEALLEVGAKLEQEEVIQRAKQELFQSVFSFSYSSEDSVVFNWSFDSLADYYKERLEHINLPRVPKFQVKPNTNRGDDFFYDMEKARNHLSKNSNPKNEDLEDSVIKNDEIFYFLDKNSSRRKNLANTKFEWIIQELAGPLKERKSAENISKERLDSLIRFSLQKRGITLPYTYEIRDMHHAMRLSRNEKKEEAQYALFEVPIFTSDFVSFPQILSLRFSRQSSFLLGKIWLVLAGSAVLTLVILFCFGFAIFIIIRQKKLSDMKSDFINNMTHELKTPIATIGLAVEALQDIGLRKDPTFQARYLAMIEEENGRLAHQVERVLQMAQMEKNEIQYEKEAISANELVKEAIKKINIQIEKRSGTIHEELDAKEDIVTVDPIHFLQVVLNLLDNAVKYSLDNVHIRVKSYNKNGRFVLEVKDHGMGMSKEYLTHIFQQFYRVPTGNLHDVKGFGLGLAYVRLVMEAHNGTVSAESELNRGSTFTLTLPFSDL